MELQDWTEMARAEARRLFDLGVDAADPGRAVTRALNAAPLSHPAPLLLSVGKAAIAMAESALDHVTPSETIVVTNPENARDVPDARVFASAHPVPDAIGAEAGAHVIDRLSRLGEGDAVLALISGGGSALLPAPVGGVSLEDKAAVNAALLASGADITDMNLVRQQLSRLKGGGMVRVAAPARVRALILSDVVGDDLRVIASGPTVSPIGTQAEARAILKERNIWDSMPASVRAALSGSAPAPLSASAENTLVGSNGQSRAAMLSGAPDARLWEADLEGDVQDAARAIADWADGPGTWLMGGETTVQIKGTGRGGRNQELAVLLAHEAQARGWGPWVYLQGGTDGRDGPTDAAGGIVDAGSLDRMVKAGCDVDAMLANNDSYALLKASGDLLMTGGTGTNVADLGVLIRA